MKWERIDAAVAKAIEGLGYQASKRDQDELRAALEDVKEQVADEKEADLCGVPEHANIGFRCDRCGEVYCRYCVSHECLIKVEIPEPQRSRRGFPGNAVINEVSCRAAAKSATVANPEKTPYRHNPSDIRA